MDNNKPIEAMTDPDDALVERLRNPRWHDCNHHLVMDQAADTIKRLKAHNAETIERAANDRATMLDGFAMAVAEMSRARGRLETIATCNEDRRIAAALGSTCDYLRRNLTKEQQS